MFTTPCFIRKNTSELRKKLDELCYLPPNKVWYDENFAICTIYRDNRGEYFTFKIDDDFERIIAPSYPYIDCGTNEEMFLALAALRDDTDKYQQFVCIKSYCDCFDLFHDKGYFAKCITDRVPDSKYWRKATAEEIIEHFTMKGGAE